MYKLTKELAWWGLMFGIGYLMWELHKNMKRTDDEFTKFMEENRSLRDRYTETYGDESEHDAG